MGHWCKADFIFFFSLTLQIDPGIVIFSNSMHTGWGGPAPMALIPLHFFGTWFNSYPLYPSQVIITLVCNSRMNWSKSVPFHTYTYCPTECDFVTLCQKRLLMTFDRSLTDMTTLCGSSSIILHRKLTLTTIFFYIHVPDSCKAYN